MKKFLFSAIFLLILIAGYGQKEVITETGTSFTLDESLPGSNTYNYTASQFIRLTGDNTSQFSYAPATGQSFQAKIDPFMVIPPEYESGGPYPEENAGVGTIAGDLAITNTGAAMYNIPIEISPGISGMTPELALVYNSMAGDGVVGPGWSVSGIPVISNVRPTKYYTEEYINYEYSYFNAYEFTLNGQRLFFKAQMEISMMVNIEQKMMNFQGLKNCHMEKRDCTLP